MSILITGDLHSHTWERFSTTMPDGQNSRFADLMNVCDQISHYIEEHRPDYVVVGGDVTHRRYFVRFSTYTPTLARIKTWDHQTDGGVICTVGNHDYEAEGVHSLGPLALAGVRIVDRPEWVELRDYGWVYFVPYAPDVVASILNADDGQRYPTGAPRTAILHYMLDGKVLDNEYAVPSPLRLSDLDGFERIIFNHVHSPSIEHQGRVTYVGAPWHMDFGDVGPRYVWLLNEEGLTPLPITAPVFVTANYPRVPVPQGVGFLRVLGVPAALAEDVKRAARKVGWSDVLTIEEAMPTEAIRALSSAVLLDEAVVTSYVARQFLSVDEAARAAMVEYGLACLRQVRP